MCYILNIKGKEKDTFRPQQLTERDASGASALGSRERNTTFEPRG